MVREGGDVAVDDGRHLVDKGRVGFLGAGSDQASGKIDKARNRLRHVCLRWLKVPPAAVAQWQSAH